MSNKVQILDKIQRNAQQLGITVNSNSGSAVVIENGSNDITISYVDADLQAPMGGVDGSATPFLGIGTANPGKIKMKTAISTADNVTDVLDGTVAVQVFQLLCGFANDIQLENSDASYSEDFRGHADLLGMGH